MPLDTSGGRDRTAAEWRTLLAAGDFGLVADTPAGPLHVLATQLLKRASRCEPKGG